MGKYYKVEIVEVAYTPVELVGYYDDSDEGRRGFSDINKQASERLTGTRRLLFTSVELTDEQYAELQP